MYLATRKEVTVEVELAWVPVYIDRNPPEVVVDAPVVFFAIQKVESREIVENWTPTSRFN